MTAVAHHFKDSSLYYLFNLHDEKAKGRSVMLASSIMTGIIGWLTGGLFYTSFLMHNGIDLVKIGIISFVPYIANCFAVFAPSILERFPKRRWVLFGGRLVYYLLTIFSTTVMPFLVTDPDLRTLCFAILIFAANITNALFAGGYSAWHINFIPNNVRAEYFSTSSMISNFIALGTALISSLVADAFSSSPYAYTIIIILRLAAFALALLELWFLLQPAEYPYEKSGDKVRFSDIFTKPFSHPKFMYTLLLMGLWTFFVDTSASSINYYLLNDVGVSYTFTFTLNMLYPFFILFLLKPVNRLIRQHGWLPMFAVGAILYAIPSFTYSFVTAANYLWLMPIVRLTQHAFGVLLNTAYSNVVYINMPESDRVSYLAFYSIFINALAFCGVLFGTWFVGTFPNLDLVIGSLHFGKVQVLMWVESFGRAFVGILTLAMMRSLRPDET